MFSSNECKKTGEEKSYTLPMEADQQPEMEQLIGKKRYSSRVKVSAQIIRNKNFRKIIGKCIMQMRRCINCPPKPWMIRLKIKKRSLKKVSGSTSSLRE
jgi:hypothetical protein